MGTPAAGTNFQCPATPNTPIEALPANLSYGYIYNPWDGPGTLWINQTGDATTTYDGTSLPLRPGWTWFAIPGSTVPVSACSTFANHLFICVQVPA